MYVEKFKNLLDLLIIFLLFLKLNQFREKLAKIRKSQSDFNWTLRSISCHSKIMIK